MGYRYRFAMQTETKMIRDGKGTVRKRFESVGVRTKHRKSFAAPHGVAKGI